jgi:RNA polymerase sigma factor (sigma-70 family)
VNSEVGTPKTGPETAVALLLDREQVERLMGLAFKRFGIRREEAEELLAETLLELSGSRAAIKNHKGFAFHIFYIRCCRWLERERRRRDEPAGLDPGAGRPNGHGAAEAEWSVALRQAFGRLSPGCRRLLVGYYYEGLTLKEAGEVTGHSWKQVWKRLDGCLRRLKQCLEV